MARKRFLHKVGVTTLGVPVVAGVYKLYETHGLPLDVLIGTLYEKRYLPCWLSLFDEGVAAGVRPDRWARTIVVAVSDTLGEPWTSTVRARLKVARCNS